MIWIFNPVTLLVVFILYAQLEKKNIAYWPVTVIGAAIDFLVNVTWFTLIFWDIPKEWLLTKRVERLKSSTNFYRYKLAWLLSDLMNKILPGHCR